MTPIHLVLFQPDHPRFAIFNSFQEVIDSLEWGFRALGYDVSVLRNAIGPGRNIVFGWIPAFQLGSGAALPPDTILFNMEQFANGDMRGAATLEEAAAKFQIWDYSAANLPAWQRLAPRHPVYHAPISYAPTLERLPQVAEDIDMLYVGSLAVRRAEKLIATMNAGYSSLVTLCNVWGAQRDSFIARAKLMLNVSNDDPLLRIFEVVRVSYYLANRKAVLSELSPNQFVEDDLRQVLRFYAMDQLGQGAQELLADDARRRAYADACYDVFRQRDVRDVIRGFFG
jgi:hypothetical protein